WFSCIARCRLRHFGLYAGSAAIDLHVGVMPASWRAMGKDLWGSPGEPGRTPAVGEDGRQKMNFAPS
ncbi:MAG: hypothetical protein ACRD18_14415, partial [Terriglobia bacterium]